MEVVERSSTVNKAQLVGTLEGDIIVHSFDWTGYLAPFFRKIKSPKTYHRQSILWLCSNEKDQ